MGFAVAAIAFVAGAWSVPAGVIAQGAIVGALTSLLALGIALVWRANRIINFAAGDLGAVPATLAVLLTVSTLSVGWWPAFGVGLAAALILGYLVEVLLIRPFFRAPRLVLSVATIGVAQLLAAGALLLPDRFHVTDRPIPAPFDVHFTIDPIIFRGNDVIAIAAVPLVFGALALFLTRSDLGIAIRGGAERADRASTLGIPVRRLHMVVWVIATVLAFLAVWLRAGIVGLPIGQVLGPAILLRALAAAVIGRMDRFPTIIGAAVVLGIVEQSIIWHSRDPALVDPVLFVVVLVALLLTRRPSGARDDEASTWQAAREARPVPRELVRLPEVRLGRVAIVTAVVGFLLVVPAFLTLSQVNLAAAILIFAIVGLSLVVLTGWAGQVSLGQMAFAGIGAAVAGTVTSRVGWDLSIALLVGGLVGAGVAVIIGLPALRRRGLTLAVTTLAFALMTSSWLLNPNFFGAGSTFSLPLIGRFSTDWLPSSRIARPDLFGFISIRSETSFYYFCVLALAVAYVMVRGLRASRTGRALVAIRENEQAAEAFGLSARRTTLVAFAFSGFLAAFAGALFVHHQTGFDLQPFQPVASLEVFSLTVIGGLGSAPGALLGAAYVKSIDYFLASNWRFLLTGGGLVFVLMVFPGGIGAAFAGARDWLLRLVAKRRDLAVPSLVADVGTAAPPPLALDDAPRRTAVRVPEPPAAAEAALLQTRELDVAYDRVQVLFGVTLHVGTGEIVALLGTNGAGKSTLLRAIAGLCDVTHGTIRIGGRETTKLRADQLAAAGVASVPGGQGTFPSLTVNEHLRLAAWTRRRDPAAARAARAAALEHFPDLCARLDTPAGALSGGQQQMLTLSMALVAQPRALLLDELSLGLAPAIVSQLLGVVRDLAARGTSILLVEQSVNLALQVAARAYFMEKGEIRFEGPTADLLERPDIMRAVFLEGAAPPRATSARPREPVRPVAAPGAADQQAARRLIVSDVSKHFGGITALRDVSFTLEPGQILGVLGPNGAGKTTLFDVICGFERADAGRVALGNGTAHDLTRLAPSVRARQGLGRSFQDARLFPALTVTETIAVSLEDDVAVRDPVAAALHLPAVRESEEAVARRVDELIEVLQLGAYRDKYVRELSTGTRRVVDLACVIGHHPAVLLLDEPSSGIAQREAEALAPLLRRVRDDLGASFVVIEHDLTLLREIADRLLALDLGRVVATGDPDDVVHDPAVVASYLGTDAAAAARSGRATD
jgi:ABC-type branched-subunit amino acid transport system ATPase component/ABC-type branched-subunit amino acid transport system permease subunit